MAPQLDSLPPSINASTYGTAPSAPRSGDSMRVATEREKVMNHVRSPGSSRHAFCPLHPLLVLLLDLSHACIDGGYCIALSLGGLCFQRLHLGFGLIHDLL